MLIEPGRSSRNALIRAPSFPASQPRVRVGGSLSESERLSRRNVPSGRAVCRQGTATRVTMVQHRRRRVDAVYHEVRGAPPERIVEAAISAAADLVVGAASILMSQFVFSPTWKLLMSYWQARRKPLSL